MLTEIKIDIKPNYFMDSNILESGNILYPDNLRKFTLKNFNFMKDFHLCANLPKDMR